MRKAELKEEEEQKSREVSISFTTTDHLIMFFASQVTVQRRQEKLQKAAPNVRPVFAVQTEEEKDATAEHKIEVEQKAHLVRPVVFYLFYSPLSASASYLSAAAFLAPVVQCSCAAQSRTLL